VDPDTPGAPRVRAQVAVGGGDPAESRPCPLPDIGLEPMASIRPARSRTFFWPASTLNVRSCHVWKAPPRSGTRPMARPYSPALILTAAGTAL